MGGKLQKGACPGRSHADALVRMHGLAVGQHAPGCMVGACRRAALEESLSAMGLAPAGDAVVVPVKVCCAVPAVHAPLSLHAHGACHGLESCWHTFLNAWRHRACLLPLLQDGLVMPFPTPPAAKPEATLAPPPAAGPPPATQPAPAGASPPVPSANPEAADTAGDSSSSGTPDSNGGSSGLSAGAIAGIAVGGVAVVAAAAGLGYWRRRREQQGQAAGARDAGDSAAGSAAAPASKVRAKRSGNTYPCCRRLGLVKAAVLLAHALP